MDCRGNEVVEVRAIMGADGGNDKEVVILGLIVRWTNSGIEFEADKRHREMLLSKCGLERSIKGLVNKSDKDGKEEEGDRGELSKEELRQG